MSIKAYARHLVLAVSTTGLLACADASQPVQGKHCPVPGTGDTAFEAPASALDAALRCYPAAGPTQRPSVLLVHGTALNAEGNFSWNYVPALTALGWPVCTVDLPGYAQDDAQASAEYVVFALRRMAQTSQGPVKIIGFSQGGMLPRWALRYWTDARGLTDELIALAGSNHGTVVANAACLRDCPESNWQQRQGSAFLGALNRDFETLPEIHYTNIYTWMDEIVQPNLPGASSTSLAGGSNVTNIAVQEICPGHVADHLALGTYDAVGFALALDALEQDGPAQAERIARTVCAQPYLPFMTPASFAAGHTLMLDTLRAASQSARRVPAEPSLRCYAAQER